jgi:hypothetical protein
MIAPAVHILSTHDCSDIVRCQKANQHEALLAYRRRGIANLTQVKTPALFACSVLGYDLKQKLQLTRFEDCNASAAPAAGGGFN